MDLVQHSSEEVYEVFVRCFGVLGDVDVAHFFFQLGDLCGWKGVSEAAELIENDTQRPNIGFFAVLFVFPDFW